MFQLVAGLSKTYPRSRRSHVCLSVLWFIRQQYFSLVKQKQETLVVYTMIKSLIPYLLTVRQISQMRSGSNVNLKADQAEEGEGLNKYQPVTVKWHSEDRIWHRRITLKLYWKEMIHNSHGVESIQADRNITLCLSSCSTSLGDRVSSSRTAII